MVQIVEPSPIVVQPMAQGVQLVWVAGVPVKVPGGHGLQKVELFSKVKVPGAQGVHVILADVAILSRGGKSELKYPLGHTVPQTELLPAGQ